MTAAIRQTDGSIAHEWSYDPWGRRRNPANFTDYNSSGFTDALGANGSQLFTLGYTGHACPPVAGAY